MRSGRLLLGTLVTVWCGFCKAYAFSLEAS